MIPLLKKFITGNNVEVQGKAELTFPAKRHIT
jgi:hypothetical protein